MTDGPGKDLVCVFRFYRLPTSRLCIRSCRHIGADSAVIPSPCLAKSDLAYTAWAASPGDVALTAWPNSTGRSRNKPCCSMYSSTGSGIK